MATGHTDEGGTVPGRWWHQLPDGRIQCDLCPRACRLAHGQRAFCFVRQNIDGQMALTSYGRSTGFCVDPIEKKPLHHFYPGSAVLSFGTAGCNLGCKFCQNWDISKARETRRLSAWASPINIAKAAQEAGALSVAATYNDPVIFAEYAIDTFQACHELGLKTVAVTAGYITHDARPAFYEHLDAVNVDLKAFTNEFYRTLCFAELDPVLDTIKWIHDETDTWLEVTTLLIPGHNDSPKEVARLVDWYLDNLGPDVPLHFSAFHPDFKMKDMDPTPPATIQRAREQAKAKGLHHVYCGNVHDLASDATICSRCGEIVIQRDWYNILNYRLDTKGRCAACGCPMPGHFGPTVGSWGRRRLPVRV